MFILLNFFEKFQTMNFFIYVIIFGVLTAIIDTNLVMRNFKINSKNYAKVKICTGDIISGVLLIKIFCVLNADLTERKLLICNLGFIFLTILFKIIISVLNDKLKLLSNIDIINKNRFAFGIIIAVSMTFFIFDVTMQSVIKDNNYIRYAYVNIAIMIYVYANFEFFVWIKKLQKQNIKLHVLESQNKNLTIMYDNMRGFKHDFSNFVQALDGYAKTNDIEGVKSMCESLTKDYKKVNNMEIISTDMLNNSAVGCILTNKYFVAIQANITVNIECLIDLAETKQYSYEFCRILSILLDNAIEAAKQSDEKIINIKICKDFQLNRKLIIIENSYNQVDIDLEKIFEKGYSSKENSNKEHGLGLWTVRKILNKSNNLNLFTTKDELFRQQLEIYR